MTTLPKLPDGHALACCPHGSRVHITAQPALAGKFARTLGLPHWDRERSALCGKAVYNEDCPVNAGGRRPLVLEDVCRSCWARVPSSRANLPTTGTEPSP